ncbi:hypothetical protein [Butyrivibrio sp. VCD2006]|uniref:hypothetical protein n=1 Tax=Butyrivibrio sp. VCD2006 TaxID=1280664 RepID=UPI0003FD1F37|nr:hypothetical protein [Butyrivibrio sp. VCD2006]
MKTVTIDFTNQILKIQAKKYEDTKKFESFEKESLAQFFPEKKFLTDYNSYTWDFDANVFIVNQDKKKISTETGEIRYYPELIIPMPNLSRRYKDFMNIVMTI